MAANFPCPNTTCDHQFPQLSVRAAVLCCPKCELVIPLQALPGPATPLLNAVPLLGMPATGPANYETMAAMYHDVPSPREDGGGSPWLKVLILLLLFGGAAGFGYYEFFVREPVRKPQRRLVEEHVTPEGHKVVQSHPMNFSFHLPRAPWMTDDVAKTNFPSCAWALRHGESNGGLVIWAKDYKNRTPRDSTVIKDGTQKLEEYFGSIRVSGETDTTLADQRAMVLAFTANDPETKMPVEGICYLMAYRGIGYGFITWSVDAQETAKLANGFGLLGDREKWAKEIAKTQVLKGKAMAYTLYNPHADWKESPELLDNQVKLGDTPDLLVHAKDLVTPAYLSKAAKVMVFVRPSALDLAAAADRARKQVEDYYRKDYPSTKSIILRDREGVVDRDQKIGKVPGHLTKLQIINGDSSQRFVILATVLQPDAVLEIQCDCPWNRRATWERSFDELLSSLRLEAPPQKSPAPTLP